MAKKPELSIVLPCYNESRNIPIIVQELSKFWPETNFELILVNNGSIDDSAEILRQMVNKYSGFVKSVIIKKNIGYGHGILTGLKEAEAEVLAYSHADMQTPPGDIIKAYKIFKENQSKQGGILVKGLRVNRPEQEQFFTRYLSKVTTVILGYKTADINGQPKVFPRILLKYLVMPPKDFSFDVYVMYISRLIGLKLITFPVDFGNRVYGASNWSTSFIKKYKTIFKYLISILKIGVKHRLFYKIKPVFNP
jgi:glycosyltransferase involved in cell wall biosynthesis